jgi:hypothetical protein
MTDVTIPTDCRLVPAQMAGPSLLDGGMGRRGAKAAAAPAGGFGGGSGAADTSNTDPLGPRHHNSRC